jgi:hypothetical protein
MFDPIEMVCEFFEGLTAIDRAIVDRVAEEPCRDCGGPLYRGDFPRKPRGGVLAILPRWTSRVRIPSPALRFAWFRRTITGTTTSLTPLFTPFATDVGPARAATQLARCAD